MFLYVNGVKMKNFGLSKPPNLRALSILRNKRESQIEILHTFPPVIFFVGKSYFSMV